MPAAIRLSQNFSVISFAIALFIGFLSLNAMTAYADGCSAANFKGGRDFAVGQYPYALAAADFNTDGKADIAAADYFGNNVRVAFGDGAGGFASVNTFATGMKPIAIAVGDLNNDTKPDLVVSNQDSNNISVLINDGSGNFTVTTYSAGVAPGEMVLADINDDLKLDVAVLNPTAGTVIIFPNDGAGGLLPLNFIALPPTSNPTDIVSADFNHDGKVDIATSNASGSFSVILRTGANTFGSPTTTVIPGVGDYKSIAVGDFTGDNELDLVLGAYSGTVRVLKGNGTGAFTFTPAITFPSGSSTLFNVYLSDINSDGKLDIIAASDTNSLTNSLVRIIYGDGLGGSSQTSDLLLGVTLRSVAITDLNGDSKQDIVANYGSLIKAGLAVSLNDGTGKLETATIIGTSGVTLAGSTIISDFNFDGRPDLAWVTNGTLQIRLGLATGELATAVTIGANGANHLVVGDFNGDFKPDIATSNGAANSVSVFLNNGLGGFLTPVVYSVGSSAKALAVGDFNGDGKLDLAVNANGVRAVRVFNGDGMGSFVLLGSSPANANPASIVAGDFNNDGKLDVVTANECVNGGCTSRLVTFLPGNGNSTFGAPVDLSTQSPVPSTTYPGIFPNFLATADFNGDGRPDLAWGRSNPDNYYSPLQVSLNTGGGTFAAPFSLADSYDSLAIATGDVNNDGRPDIVGASEYGEVQVFLNNGAASFADPINYSGVSVPLGVTIGDINNDGKRDIIFAQSGALWRILNKCALSRGAHTSDFDGDGITDISVFRPTTGTWYLLYSSNGSFHAIPFGAMGDVPVIGDYDGDGKSDVAVFRPSNGIWYYLNSSDGSFHFQQFGANGDIPVPGDYDGDGLTNFAVWRPTTGYWYTSLNPATNYGAVLWGASSDRPIPADYDGDGRTDIAVYRPSTAYWYLLRSSLGYQEQQFGIPNDVPVPADFDNDGRANFAVFRDTTGWWYTSLSPATNYGGVQLGQSGDTPVPGFYDADGRADAAVFRLGDWYVHQSNTGNVAGTHFGSSGDEPAPSAIHHP